MVQVPTPATPTGTGAANNSSGANVTTPQMGGQSITGVSQWNPQPEVQLLITLLVIASVVVVRTYAERLTDDDDPFQSSERLFVSGTVALVTAVGVLFLVDVWGLTYALKDAIGLINLQKNVGTIILSTVLVGGAYALTSFAGYLIKETTSARVSQHQREVLYRLTQVGTYAAVGFIILTLFIGNLQGILLGAGVLGIVLGMAARHTLGAVLAGFVLMFSRPFEIGDWVQVGEYEGTVTHVSVFQTQIQSFDGEYVMLPNDYVSQEPVVNRTRKGRLRLEVDVGIDYDNDPEHAADVAQEALMDVEDIESVPSPQVVLKEFSDSAVLLGVRFWISNPSSRRRWRAQTAAITAVKKAFEAEGIKIPYPQRELTARPEERGFRLTGGPEETRTRPNGDGSDAADAVDREATGEDD